MENYTGEEVKKYDKYDRLPKWAKEELSRTNYQLRKAEEIILSLSSNNETNTHYQIPFNIGSVVNLPINATIEFTLKSQIDETKNIKVRIKIKDNVLKINGDSQIAIIPEASNSISIKIIDS